MKKLIAIVALASSMGAAYADQPVALNDAQMDNVAAGFAAYSAAAGAGLAGALFGYTNVTSSAGTVATPLTTAAGVTVDATAFGLLPRSAAAVEASSTLVH